MITYPRKIIRCHVLMRIPSLRPCNGVMVQYLSTIIGPTLSGCRWYELILRSWHRVSAQKILLLLLFFITVITSLIMFSPKKFVLPSPSKLLWPSSLIFPGCLWVALKWDISPRWGQIFSLLQIKVNLEDVSKGEKRMDCSLQTMGTACIYNDGDNDSDDDNDSDGDHSSEVEAAVSW